MSPLCHHPLHVQTGIFDQLFCLQGGTPYVIIPCTYSPGRQGRFTLSLSAVEDFELVQLGV